MAAIFNFNVPEMALETTRNHGGAAVRRGESLARLRPSRALPQNEADTRAPVRVTNGRDWMGDNRGPGPDLHKTPIQPENFPRLDLQIRGKRLKSPSPIPLSFSDSFLLVLCLTFYSVTRRRQFF